MNFSGYVILSVVVWFFFVSISCENVKYIQRQAGKASVAFFVAIASPVDAERRAQSRLSNRCWAV